MTKEAWITRKNKWGNSGCKDIDAKKVKSSNAMKGIDNSGWIKKSIETRKQRIKEGKIRYDGEFGRNWRGGLTKKNYGLRLTTPYKLWRIKVLERDSFTCQNCKIVGGYLEVHHIKEVCKYPDLILDENNAITLCKGCHDLIKHTFKKKYEL